MIAKTLEMRTCKCIYIIPNEDNILSARELIALIPERLMYKNGAAEEYVADYYGISEESIFRIESLENPRKVRFVMSIADFIRNADLKED